MRVFDQIPEGHKFKNPVLTIGSFDGVHMGHRRIFSTLLNVSREMGGEPLVLTFDSHPRKILFPETPPKILTTGREKIKAIGDCGINDIVMLHFTKEIAEMHAIDFVNDMVFKRLGVIDLVIGYDHAFGKNREGNYEFLRQLSRKRGFGVTRAEPKNYESRPISSTWIRTELEDGNIDFANKLLGRNYTLSGLVVKGDGRGRLLDFPTANIVPDNPDKIIPRDGVYAVYINSGSMNLKGMLNIGTNPTFAKTERTIEVNIFDFNQDIYDKEIELKFHKRIRDEVKFKSAEDLIKQLHKDRSMALDMLRE